MELLGSSLFLARALWDPWRTGEETPEFVCVGRDVAAAKLDESAAEEVLEEDREGCLGSAHEAPPCPCRVKRSKRSPTTAMSSGTALRYQYVSDTLA